MQDQDQAYTAVNKPTFDVEEFHYVYYQVKTQVKIFLSQKPSDNLIVLVTSTDKSVKIEPGVIRFGSDS